MTKRIGRPDETPETRADRNLEEMLQGLRVALPGVQLIFAFLLIVPFQRRWGELTDTEQAIYFGTLLCTATSTVLLIAPTARQRLRFRGGDKEWIVVSSHRLVVAGLVVLGLAMAGVVLLVGLVVYGTWAGGVAAALVVALIAWTWFLAPLRRGSTGREGREERARRGSGGSSPSR